MAEITTEESLDRTHSTPDTETEKTEPQNSAEPVSATESADPQNPLAIEKSGIQEPEGRTSEGPAVSDSIESPSRQESPSPESPETPDPQPEPSQSSDAQTPAGTDEQAQPRNPESADHPVYDAIQKLAQSDPAACFSSWTSDTRVDGRVLNRPARSAMNTRLLWLAPGDSVETALQRMQQKHIRYGLVKEDDRLEAVFSQSDLNAALSPYLKPAFEQYRRPLDDASLQIRIKWFMSRPVHTVGPETPLWKVMEMMCRHDIRALPVQDTEGVVLGLVTPFEIFQAFVTPDPEIQTQEPESESNPSGPSAEPGPAEASQPPEPEEQPGENQATPAE